MGGPGGPPRGPGMGNMGPPGMTGGNMPGNMGMPPMGPRGPMMGPPMMGPPGPGMPPGMMPGEAVGFVSGWEGASFHIDGLHLNYRKSIDDRLGMYEEYSASCNLVYLIKQADNFLTEKGLVRKHKSIKSYCSNFSKQ